MAKIPAFKPPKMKSSKPPKENFGGAKMKTTKAIKGTPPSSSKPGVRPHSPIGNDKAKAKGAVRNRKEKNPAKRKK